MASSARGAPDRRVGRAGERAGSSEPERPLVQMSILGSVLQVLNPQRSLTDEILETSAGVTLLAALESGALDVELLEDIHDLDVDLSDTSDATIERAVALVRGAEFFDLMAIAVQAAMQIAGPHSTESPWRVARALRQAPARRPIAEAIVERFGTELEAPLQRPDQQWWNLFELGDHNVVRPLGRRPHPGGHWAWFTAPANWFFTINPAPTLLREAAGEAWDADSDDFTRWNLTVAPAARILEIHRPDDWAALVTAHPCDTRTGNYEGWEIASDDPTHRYNLDEFTGLPHQRSTRWGVQRFLEPDWASVAEHWDAVHLSWAGFLTTEGTTIDLGPGEVAMLRSWGSERTIWLNPVLSDPQPIHPSPDDRLGRCEPDPDSRTPDLRTDRHLAARQRAYLNHKLSITTDASP